MAGGAETPNIAARAAIARLGAGESARGPDADRHVKLLIQFAVKGSLSGAYSQFPIIFTMTFQIQRVMVVDAHFCKPPGREEIVRCLEGELAVILLAPYCARCGDPDDASSTELLTAPWRSCFGASD